MLRIEIHPSEGGMDSEIFAEELGSAISRYSGMYRVDNGRVVTLRAHSRL